MKKPLLETLALRPKDLERYPALGTKEPKARRKPSPKAPKAPKKPEPIPAFHSLILSTYLAEHNCTQSQLASIMGASQPTISKVLTGKARMSDKHLARLHSFSPLYRDAPFSDFIPTITAKSLTK